MGLGYALTEDLPMKDGKPVSYKFNDIGILRAKELPEVEVIGIEEKDAKWDKSWGLFRWVRWLLLRLIELYARPRVRNMILISEYTRRFIPQAHKMLNVP